MDRLSQLEDAVHDGPLCLMQDVLRGLDRVLGFGIGNSDASRKVCWNCADSVYGTCFNVLSLANSQAMAETEAP